MGEIIEKKETNISDIVRHLREWADRLPQDPDGGFWFERQCVQMQDMLRGYANYIEKAGKLEYERGFSDGKVESQSREINFLNELLNSIGNNNVRKYK